MNKQNPAKQLCKTSEITELLYLFNLVYSFDFWFSLITVTSGIYLKIRKYTL